MKAVFIAAGDGYVAADGKPSGWLAVWVQHQRAVTTLSRMLRLNPAAGSMTPSPSSEPAPRSAPLKGSPWRPDAMDEISAVDRDALQRSLIACRAESRARSRQIDAKLRHEPWERVAQFASYSAQIESLGLSPYQDPPVYARLRNLAKPYDDPRGERESAEILKKLLALGLSRYEPHPLRAMTRG